MCYQRRNSTHAYLHRLPGDQLWLYTTCSKHALPLDRKLALAPLDDEPLTPEEAAAIDQGIASLERNGGIPMEEVLADFGLTMDDFHKMAETPLSEESGQ